MWHRAQREFSFASGTVRFKSNEKYGARAKEGELPKEMGVS